MFGAELAQRQGRPFSLPLHTNTSQGLDPLGGLRVNISGPESVLMVDSGPGKTPALAKPQHMALQADAGHVGAGLEEKQQGRSPRQLQKKDRLAWEFL